MKDLSDRYVEKYEPETRLSIRLEPDAWTARCVSVYGNSTFFLGHRVLDDDGKPVMSEEEYYRLFDRSYFADRDARWSSGEESRGLRLAVREEMSCPVRADEIRYALEIEWSYQEDPQKGRLVMGSSEYGVWGGSTAWERRTLGSKDFLPGLPFDERLRLLVNLIEAKRLGLVPESVRLDWLKRFLDGYQPECWDEERDEEHVEPVGEQVLVGVA